MEEARKPSPINLSTQIDKLKDPRQAKMYSTLGRDRKSYPIIEKKLNLMYSHAGNFSPANLQIVKVAIDNFLQGNEINLRYAVGQPYSKNNELIIRGLMNIYINSDDIALQVRAKKTIKDALNPLLNPQLAIKIIETYNNSKFNKFPVRKIDTTVNWALEKSFEMYFDYLWDMWMKKNIGPNNTFITGNFIGLIYNFLTGVNGTRTTGWFGQYYNDVKQNPEKFQQKKAEDPSQVKLDRSSHNLSDIIKYIYNPGGQFDAKRPDAFNKANQEILAYLKANVKNPFAAKVFEYIVMDKLDPEEILDMDRDFKNGANISGSFRDLAVANKKASQMIDSIYKKNGLKLPPFSTWKTSDFNKAPSDRGQLKADKPEVGVDAKGKLSKIKYNNFGDKTFSPLEEMRLFVRDFLKEYFINNKTQL